MRVGLEERYGACVPTMGGKYTSLEFFECIRSHNIRRQLTCLGTLQQNGVTERKKKHVIEIFVGVCCKPRTCQVYFRPSA